VATTKGKGKREGKGKGKGRGREGRERMGERSYTPLSQIPGHATA